MGRTHASSGALVFAAGSPLLAGAGIHLGPSGLVVGVVAAAGAALLPDLDHPSSLAARALGRVTSAIARVVAIVSGGHREGTHSFIGVIVFTALAVLVDRSGVFGRGVAAALLLVLASAGMHVRLSRRPILHVALCAVGGAALIATGDAVGAWVLPAAVAVGTAAHLGGDALTREGIPVCWPFYRGRFRLANLKTGGLLEGLIIAPAMLVSALLLTWHFVASS